MENFVLENPTKILFGRNTIDKIGQETISLGQNILLVFGQESIKKNGIYKQVQDSLLTAGISSIIEHGGVKSNPLLGHVREGVNLVKQNKLDVVLAVGGGSVIDSAKAIAAGAMAEHDVWKFFKGKKGIKSALPVTTVLTLAASGSEMNGGTVITNETTGQKLGIGNKLLCPKVSILDPTATFTVPPNYTAYGAVDAMAHILEFYFTCHDPYTPVQDRFMEGLIVNIIDSCERILTEPHNYKERANLMWCATMALNGWTAAGLGMVSFPMHMIEHSLSAIYDVPHGAGLAVVIPAWLKWYAQKETNKLSQLAERIFSINSGDHQQDAFIGIESIESWFAKINCPTRLKDLGVSSTDIPKIAENSLTQAKLWRLKSYNQQIIEEILHLAC